MKKFLTLLLASVVAAGACGCTGGNDTYYEEVYDNPLQNLDVGGSNSLTMTDSDNAVTLENAKVRIKLNAQNGAIVEYVNKESKLYLVRGGGVTAVKLVKKSGDAGAFDSFSRAVVTDTADKKAVRLRWNFGTVGVEAEVSLTADADEVRLTPSIQNNDRNDFVVSVEYPVLENVESLYARDTDYFVSPVAMGMLFNDPVTNFNGTTFAGIGKADGMYPSGWNVPMQFEGYYSKGIGGFMLSTLDGGETIKSFTCTGFAGKLRMSVHHFPSDVKSGDYDFGYDVAIGNLTRGTWQECAERYRAWAEEQKWCAQGVAKDRDDINKTLYEQTALVNFGFPYTGRLTKVEQEELYGKLKEKAGGKLLNVLFSKSDYAVELTKKNDDLLTFFEFNTFSELNTDRNNIIKSRDGDLQRYGQLVNGVQFYYQCPASANWLKARLDIEKDFRQTFGANGFYHDVAISAVHPLFCYDTSHNHGTRVNIVPDALNQIKQAKEYAVSQKIYSVGEELMFEQMLPYVDYFQARSTGGVMSWMEHDRFKSVLRNGSAETVPLFDYVYGEYGALRMDGYLNADVLLGKGYYSVAAKTALNGGLVEYNYEFLNQNEYLRAVELDDDMLSFIGELFSARATYGKDYLVYGKAVKAPAIGTGKTEYAFYNKNYNNGAGMRGNVSTDDVVVSAYTANGKTAIFFCNVTDKTQKIRFVLNALRDYGLTSGNLTRIGNGSAESLGALTDGKANVAIDLASHKVAMLVIE